MTGFYIHKTETSPQILETIPGYKNEGRLPDYHRLDINLTRDFSFFGFDGDIFFQLINAYNNKNNVQQYFYSLGDLYNGLDDDGDWDVEKHDIGSEECPGCAGNKLPDPGEPNVDELDEGQFKKNSFILFQQVIPVVGFSIKF